jgi:hypothetical protein
MSFQAKPPQKRRSSTNSRSKRSIACQYEEAPRGKEIVPTIYKTPVDASVQTDPTENYPVAKSQTTVEGQAAAIQTPILSSASSTKEETGVNTTMEPPKLEKLKTQLETTNAEIKATLADLEAQAVLNPSVQAARDYLWVHACSNLTTAEYPSFCYCKLREYCNSVGIKDPKTIREISDLAYRLHLKDKLNDPTLMNAKTIRKLNRRNEQKLGKAPTTFGKITRALSFGNPLTRTVKLKTKNELLN